MADNEQNDRLLNLIKWPMILGGFWASTSSKNPIINAFTRLYSAACKFNYFFFYCLLVLELLRLIIQGYTIDIILASFSIVANGTKAAVKVIIYLKMNVFDMLNDIRKKEKEMWEKNDNDMIKIYLKNIEWGRLSRFLLSASTIIVVSAIQASAIFAYIQMKKYNEANNATLESHLTYQFWVPIDKLNHIPLMVTLNLIFIYTGTLWNIITHMLIVTLLVYVCAHLSLLQHRLKTYIPANLNDEQMDETVLVLKGLIKEHQYLIEFTKQVNKRCKNIVMMEFLLSSFDVASVTTTIIKLETTEMAWFLLFFCLLVIQIFCLAWSCNELHFQSQAVGEAAFAGRWYLLNKEGQILTQIVIARAIRPLYLTIGPFGPMTAQSFLMVMKAAYSYVSIMK